ncbi:putative paraquat-inducible protein A [Salirhabdus euzebyi]|uniref:Putative paraquat-inducible protein A n=1 Tax=Salirhabdus euzebyi TaxID=394506 RepID=A0A841Q2M2_9BACI|nr:hypothetical protein [Salirhabdus euzebyi]MBB6452815.1 putative paraquat-inducible protein A [Salirhabdus euzebyi]
MVEKYRIIGWSIGLVVFLVGELFVFLMSSQNSLFPFAESFSGYLKNYFVLFYVFTIAIISLQWNGIKLMEPVFHKRVPTKEKAIYGSLAFLFVFVAPIVILIRLSHITFGNSISFSIAVLLIFLLSLFLLFIQMTTFNEQIEEG